MSALQCGELAENLQVPRRPPHKRGEVPAVVDVADVTAGAAVVAAAAATAAVDATGIGHPGEDRWCRGLPSASPPAPAPDFAADTSRVVDSTGDHTSVMSGLDSLSKSSTLPPP